jgi:hypothetical protein
LERRCFTLVACFSQYVASLTECLTRTQIILRDHRACVRSFTPFRMTNGSCDSRYFRLFFLSPGSAR